MLEAMDKITQYTDGINSADELYADDKSFDAVMMNFVVLGELVNKIPDSFKEEHSSIEWNKIKGFRNIVAHDYFGIDAEEVWQIIHNHLPDLKSKTQAILTSQ